MGRYKKKDTENAKDEDDQSTSRKRRDERKGQVCFFCDKESSHKKAKTSNSKSAATAYQLYKCTAKGWTALQEGAKSLQREDLLKKMEPLEGKSTKDLGIWYHHKCISRFRTAMSDLARRGKQPPRPKVGRPNIISEKSFEVFCQRIIKDRIIGNREVMTGRRLQKKYRKTVSVIDNFVISRKAGCSDLKRKLLTVFPDLQFVQANAQSPEVVFAVRSLEVEDILRSQGHLLPSGVDTDSESDVEGDSDENGDDQ